MYTCCISFIHMPAVTFRQGMCWPFRSVQHFDPDWNISAELLWNSVEISLVNSRDISLATRWISNSIQYNYGFQAMCSDDFGYPLIFLLHHHTFSNQSFWVSQIVSTLVDGLLGNVVMAFRGNHITISHYDCTCVWTKMVVWYQLM